MSGPPKDSASMPGESGKALAPPPKDLHAAAKTWTDILESLGWIVANVVSSLACVLCNKSVLQTHGFHDIATLNVLHSLATVGMLEFLAAIGGHDKGAMPMKERVKVGSMSVVSVQLQNTSLLVNSVGFYQIFKLLVIPSSMVLESLTTGIDRKYDFKVYFSLAVMSAGVLVAVVHDVQTTLYGCAIALSATVFTAQFQIWQGSKQREFTISAVQLSRAFSMPQLVVGAIVAIPADFIFGDIMTYKPTFDFYVALFGSCLFAIGVQVSSTGLIGKTSPVTYQVVGQIKSILTLFFGHIWFDAEHPASALLGKLLGFSAAIGGASLYANQRLFMSKQVHSDWLALFNRRDGSAKPPV